MPIAFKCPKCGKQYKVKDELAGKVAGCVCGVKFKIPAPKIAPPPPPMPEPEPEPEEFAYDDEPVDEQGPVEDYGAEPEEEAADDYDAGDEDDGAAYNVEPEAAEEPEDDYGAMPEHEEESFDVGMDDSFEEDKGEEDTGQISVSDIEDGMDKDEDDSEESDEDEDEEPGQAKSWPGRILILLGAACIAAGLFLPWGEFPGEWFADAPKAVEAKPAEKADDADNADDADSEDDADAKSDDGATSVITATGVGMIMAEFADDEDKDEDKDADASEDGEAKADESGEVAEKPAPKASNKFAGNVSPTGLELAQKLGAKNPMGFAIFGIIGVAALLAILALVPGLALSGTPQMILGLLLTLGVPGAFAVSLLAIGNCPGADGFAAAFGFAGLGLWLTVGGVAACFIGGLICSFGVFKNASASKPKAPGRGARGGKADGGRERGGRGRSTVRVSRGAKDEDGDGDSDDSEAEEEDKPKKSARPKPPLGAKSGPLKPPFAKKAGKKVSKKVIMKPRKKG